MVQEAGAVVGRTRACDKLGVARATYYRRIRPREFTPRPPRPKPARTLAEEERKAVLEVMHSERFVDKAPATVVATLLDEGRYLCSTRTVYRILAGADEIRERRRQARRPEYKKPELLATAPNQVWSWDITKLKGPIKWTYHYLYVIIDIFSRNVVGWMVADRENAGLAQLLIDESCEKQNILPGELVIHSDRGSPMIAKGTAQLLADLGITKSHSRPYVSDDNPFSEAHFKTLKYRPDFPRSFGSIEDAKAFCRNFFSWYNGEHRHSGIAYLTPNDVHYGRAVERLENRQVVMDVAFKNHPERFVRKAPLVTPLPEAAWINPPARQVALEEATQ
ncbi:MAG TPA: IS3 family transposase [Cyanobacteria bacterium UBA8530]|nr:IS3 family transposase [Cyanobacteria bacterium UBA8530]